MKKTAIITLLVLAVVFVGMAASSDKIVRDAIGDPAIGGPLTLNENLTWSSGGFTGTWAYGEDINMLFFVTHWPNGTFALWYAERIAGTWFYQVGGMHPFSSLNPNPDPFSFNMLD